MFNIFRRKKEENQAKKEKIGEEQEIKDDAIKTEVIEDELIREDLIFDEKEIIEEPEIEERQKLDIEGTADKKTSKWKLGLSKTRKSFFGRIGDLISRKTKIDPELLDEMEEIMIQSDIGVETTMRIMDKVRERVKEEKLEGTPGAITQLLKDELLSILGTENQTIDTDTHKPFVIMVLGVNGTGKTTTIAKLAARFRRENKKVILAAADTFRAAAVEQLEIWSQRVGGVDFKTSGRL